VHVRFGGGSEETYREATRLAPTLHVPAPVPKAVALERQNALLRQLMERKESPAPPSTPAPATNAPTTKPEKRVHRQMGYLQFEAPKDTKEQEPRFVLSPGDTIIPCSVLSAMHSDIESNATVKVVTNIYDTETRRRLLIPQGSTILVRYFSAHLVSGNER
jgi:type IV secretory pathway VirB10-like protein